DHNAPTVSFTPADGSTNVPLDAVVKITFNEPVHHANGEIIAREDIPELVTFKLNDENGEDVEYEAMVDMWKEVITLFPENNLVPDQQYYLEVDGGAIADNSGNVMENTASATFITTEHTGVDKSHSRELVVHPNPGNGVFKLNNETGKQVDFQVMDIHGREIIKLTYVDEPTVTINLSDQPDGVYLLKMKMTDNGKSVIVKIIKQ
ncbi:MAG: Ig-like domain-containing protein, partial [Bacteroidales bacterium]|nr:Ig-like domain-containing protein [Bacteroidales bacterium]